MEKPLIVANWKMNPRTEEEAKQIARFSDKERVVVCPPFVFLQSVRKEIKKATLGAQNCFFEKRGAFTGEISPTMLKNCGCKYVIIGHSERRDIFNESEEEIKKKINVLLEEGITPIFCVGEDDNGSNCVKEQLKSIGEVPIKKIIIAYEPKSAIGTGKPCDVDEAEKKKVFIKSILVKSHKKAEDITILYGGSVTAKNALTYVKKAGFQGLLIGGASLREKEFEKILKELSL